MSAARIPRLTDRQRLVLSAVMRLVEERGFAPTLREIGEAVGIVSTNGVLDHLKALERKGYLLRAEEGGKTRTLRVLRDGDGQPLEDKDAQIERLQRRVADLEKMLSAIKLLGEITKCPHCGR